MIEVIEQTIDRAKLDHDLIVPITTLGPHDELRHLHDINNLSSVPPTSPGGRQGPGGL